jgi:hypothetical protein
MRNFSIIVSIILMGCSSKETFQTQFPIPISHYFYQTKGNQTLFFIEFKQAIPENIKLEKLYFKNQTAVIKIISSQKVEAVFIKNDFILDANPEKEYGNQLPIAEKPKFNLKPTEAVLEYSHKNNLMHHKFLDVAEKSNN